MDAPAAKVQAAPPRTGRFLLALGVCMVILAAVPAGLAFAAATAVVRAGTVAVHVDDAGPGGTVHLVVPTALLDVAVATVPDRVFLDVARELDREGARLDREGLAALSDAIRSLPDAVLVEVRDGDTHAVVESVGGRIRIRVDDGGDRVRIDVPAGTVGRILDRLADAA